MTKFGNIIYNYRLLFLALIAFTAAAVLDKNADLLDSRKINTTRFQQVLNDKYELATEKLAQIDEIVKRKGLDEFKASFAEDYYRVFDENGIIILGYDNQELIFWNSNILPLQISELQLDQDNNKIVNPGNGWYVKTRLNTTGHPDLVALILIKYDYVFENEFLVNDFHKDFHLFPEASLKFSKESTNQITTPEGEFLFAIEDPDPEVYSDTFHLFACILYIIGFILFLLFLHQSMMIFSKSSVYAGNIFFFIVVILLFAIRYLMLSTGFPNVFSSFQLFQPHHYAASSLLPSLGDFLITSIFVLFLTICFFRHFRLFNKNTETNRLRNTGWVVLLSFVLVIFMLFVYNMISSLIHNSNIQLEVYNFFYLTWYSLVAYLAIAILLASFVLLSDRLVFLASTLVELKIFLFIIPGIFIAGILLYNGITDQNINYVSTLFFITLTAGITVIRYFRFRYTYSLQVLLVLLISAFTVAFVTKETYHKEKKIRQVLVVNLANERDQIAEFLLEEMSGELKKDSVIYSTLSSAYYDDYELFEYLESQYFTGYFRNYDLQIASCGHDFDLLLEDMNELVDCYTFFYNMTEDHGIPVSQHSDFYFLDNLNGRISYLGTVVYEFGEFPHERTLFISIDSKVLSDQLGYPELLIEGKFSGNPAMSQYSHAKYNNNQLVTRYGTYTYPLTLQFETESEQELSFMRKGGHEHLVYQVDNENVIIMSKPEITSVNLLTSLSYSFAFFYLIYSLALVVCRYPFNLKKWRINFKNKIKFSMIGILLLSLIIIGAGTVYYNIRQFDNKQFENISEKIQSVLVELEYRLGMESELPEEISYYITDMLIQFSNVFYTDINLYDLKGNLYASSRPEIFELGLIGEQMNPTAYSEMLLKKNARFVQKESINNLSYLSAYVPFKNADNEVLSYLNLPYFTRQSILKKEIYTLVIAVANIYAILILITILLAIIVSNTITKPLQLIQKKLRELSIGRKNEQIDYDSDDEIGSLIKEYNRMVEELDNSAGLLARSERESAWREMAKQIAHEIKNPLTPMKLSIQHLQRAKDDKVDNWDEVFKKTTRNLVEQIDHLSSIATAFSHFAKIPGTNKGSADIVPIIKNVAELFSSSENIKIPVELNGIDELHVTSDKVQINRVFINLLKNAIQSIPEGRKGRIEIELVMEDKMALIRITDNGEGVPPELKSKMFTPYFTSKSGGTGLGLAIVKNIVEQSGGNVGYESEFKNGSCFWFRIPVKHSSV
jgi:two-component system, NtrC family, nitrogen regulation sensor histidine kinase NtrY